MKREFLSNLKVGDTPLSKEVIDMIMAENGKDIEAEKAKFADYDTLKSQLEQANTTINSYKDMDIEGIKQSAADWEQKYNQAIEDGKKKIAERDFNDKVKAAITTAKGKNAKAIEALLDMESLRGSNNQDADIKAAIEACQKENEYLFGDTQNPPPYSGGTGTQGGSGTHHYTDEELSNMSYADYKAYRMGK